MLTQTNHLFFDAPALFGPAGEKETNRQSAAFGLNFPAATLEDVADDLTRRAIDCRPTRVAFVNAHCVNEMFRSREYDRAVRSADMILPDGSGVAIAALLGSGRMSPNLNGTDLAPVLFDYARRRALSVYLLGARPEVVRQAAETVESRFKDLRIAGFRDGYFSLAENEEVIAEINAAKPDILLVAMGVPYQDVWIARNADRLDVPVKLGVGGLFDFLSNRIPRAPVSLRKTGMEWTWRLAQEPARMWKRYVLGNPLFLARALRSAAVSKAAGAARGLADAVKRAADAVVSAAALAMLIPFLLPLAFAIRLDSEGPALFRQTRVGRNGKPFTMYKFRSMQSDAEARRANLVMQNHHGAGSVTFKSATDPRITKIGRFIRKYSIDELPQLWNVLKGDMSLVGPRPALPSEVARYDGVARQRLAVAPGLTCIWQTSGRGDVAFAEQVEMDLDYIRRRSFWFDLWLLVKTPWSVLTAKGAY